MAKSKSPTPSGDSTSGSIQEQIQNLLHRKKYHKALDVLQQAKRSQPTLSIEPSEAEIWVLRGRDEFDRAEYRKAESSFQQAIALEHYGESHYWLAKSLLAIDQLDSALTIIQTAFETKQLPKEWSICYLKLLFLKGDRATVEQLIEQQSKRFNAAQMHWARGVLALQESKPQDALPLFQKVKRALTPGDSPNAWIVYTQQEMGNWDAAATKLEYFPNQFWRTSASKPKWLEHPVLKRLLSWQQFNTRKKRPGRMLMPPMPRLSQDDSLIPDMLELIDEQNYHDAAHILLKLPPLKLRDPQIVAIRSNLLLLAGQQALTQGELSCVELFWQPVLKEQPKNLQLAVNLSAVLTMTNDMQAQQRLMPQLIQMIETDAKQHPENWQGDRLNLTLADAHCRLADAHISSGRTNKALAEVKTAERFAPQSPEVIGRRGLIAGMEQHNEEAIALLTQAVEGGCQKAEVYEVLLDRLRKAGNSTAVNEMRRRFGKNYGDLNAETEVELWINALSVEEYSMFARVVEKADAKQPTIRACQIFAEFTQGEMTASSGRISLKQEEASKAWDTLLEQLAPEEQVPTLQAIAISIQKFAKRDKGIAALVNRYVARLGELSAQYPAARIAHLISLAMKESDGSPKIVKPLQMYLDTMPQPGNAIAELQLQVRRFALTQGLRSSINEALKREPQNPLLLLALATTYSSQSQPYEKFKQQGFELARRLQDAKTMQAFRDEEAFLEERHVDQFMPDIDDLGDLDPDMMDSMLESMIRSMLGGKVPKAELERMIPQLKREAMNQFPFNDFEEDFDDSTPDIFVVKPKKRKRSFRNL